MSPRPREGRRRGLAAWETVQGMCRASGSTPAHSRQGQLGAHGPAPPVGAPEADGQRPLSAAQVTPPVGEHPRTGLDARVVLVIPAELS
jgi:hypothetical protein